MNFKTENKPTPSLEGFIQRSPYGPEAQGGEAIPVFLSLQLLGML